MRLSQKEYVVALEQTFATDGWKIMTEEWKERIDTIQLALLDPSVCKNWDDVIAARAIAAALVELINYPAYIESVKE